jgi:hypothetical protein
MPVSDGGVFKNVSAQSGSVFSQYFPRGVLQQEISTTTVTSIKVVEGKGAVEKH